MRDGGARFQPGALVKLPATSGQTQGFVRYSVRSAVDAPTGATLDSTVRVIFDNALPVDTATIAGVFDAQASLTMLTVANTNLAPQILPLPLQLISEGDTLNTTLRAVDGDGDAVRLALLHDATTPTGVHFDPTTGVFEWTPDQHVVDNSVLSAVEGATADRPFVFNFSATDGTATTLRSMQVRVFDVNRAPQLTVSNHALVVGETFNLPVTLWTAADPRGLTAHDPDGVSADGNPRLFAATSYPREFFKKEAHDGCHDAGLSTACPCYRPLARPGTRARGG